MSKTKITQVLGLDLQNALQNADEIWIAVALITNEGLQQIQKALPKSCKQHYLLGVDLPTPPKTFQKLLKQQFLGNDISISVFTEQTEFYHPKVYLIRTGDLYTAFVGSANCTGSGLAKNIEVSVFTDNESECKKLLLWAKEIEKKSTKLTKRFVDSYKESYELRIANKKEIAKKIRALKKRAQQEMKVFMEDRERFLKILKAYRKDTAAYELQKQERAASIAEIRNSLDYPNFEKINLDEFYSIFELGHLIPILKPAVKRNLSDFKALLKMLINEEIDIADRFDNALQSHKIEGVAAAMLSKVLTIHKPELYCVLNSKSQATLKNHGIDFPRGMSKGEKYKAICSYLSEICEEVDIENLAVLDYFLYIQANED